MKRAAKIPTAQKINLKNEEPEGVFVLTNFNRLAILNSRTFYRSACFRTVLIVGKAPNEGNNRVKQKRGSGHPLPLSFQTFSTYLLATTLAFSGTFSASFFEAARAAAPAGVSATFAVAAGAAAPAPAMVGVPAFAS